MTLRQFLDLNWKAVKYYLSMGNVYIPGAIFYRLTEMDFEDFIPKTFIVKRYTKVCLTKEDVLLNKRLQLTTNVELKKYNLISRARKIDKSEQ
jgi:hypothetical protein